jgi:hypothetical protein
VFVDDYWVSSIFSLAARPCVLSNGMVAVVLVGMVVLGLPFDYAYLLIMLTL